MCLKLNFLFISIYASEVVYIYKYGGKVRKKNLSI